MSLCIFVVPSEWKDFRPLRTYLATLGDFSVDATLMHVFQASMQLGASNRMGTITFNAYALRTIVALYSRCPAGLIC